MWRAVDSWLATTVIHRGKEGGEGGTKASKISRESWCPEEWAPRAPGKDEDNPADLQRERGGELNQKQLAGQPEGQEEGRIWSSLGIRKGMFGGRWRPGGAPSAVRGGRGAGLSQAVAICREPGSRAGPAPQRLRVGAGGLSWHRSEHLTISRGPELRKSCELPEETLGVMKLCPLACVSDVLCTLPTSIQNCKFGLKCAQWRKEIWAENRTINCHNILCSWPLCVCRVNHFECLTLPNPKITSWRLC